MPSDAPPPLPLRAHPALALAVYGEELAHGARVAVFGDAALGLAEELIERGARLVHVYDSDAARVAEATARAHDRAIYFARLPEGGDAGVRDGAFDLVMVPDLSLCGDVPAMLAVARRVLAAQGAAMIASPNPQSMSPALRGRPGIALGYYELYEAVVAQFPSVRMLGQVPFVGYAIAEFAAVDPEPTIDNSLATEQEPEWFVALASQRGVRLEAFALVELPAHSLEPLPAPEWPASEPDDAVEPLAPASGTVLVNILEAEREAALEALRQQDQRASEERARADQATSALLALREELTLARARHATLERDLSAEQDEKRRLAARLDEQATLGEQLNALQEAAVRATHEHAQRSEQSKADYEARLRRAATELEATTLRLQSERDADAKRAAAAHAAAIAEREAEARALAAAYEQRARDSSTEYEADVARLEGQLVEIGRAARELDREVARREKLVREIVATYVVAGADGSAAPLSIANGAAPLPTADSELQGKLETMSAAAATREADLMAARWKIAQLERELGQRR